MESRQSREVEGLYDFMVRCKTNKNGFPAAVDEIKQFSKNVTICEKTGEGEGV